MNISDLIKLLEAVKDECGDLPVMYVDPNSNGGPFGVERVSVETAEHGQFPKSYKMPAGFKWVELNA